MKTMNGITNELVVRKTNKNWRSRCGAFVLAALVTLSSGRTAFGEVVITTPAGREVQQNYAFDSTPGGGANPGQNAGGPYTNNSRTQYAWNGPAGTVAGTQLFNNLNYLVAGMDVNTIGTGGTVVGQSGTHRLSSADRLSFEGSGGQVSFTSSLDWTQTSFTVGGNATATIYAQGGFLNLGGQLTNAGVINLTTLGTVDTGSNNGISVYTGSTNTGEIHLTNTVLNLYGGLGSGGTIYVEDRGQLNVRTGSTNQDIVGNFSGNNGTRSLIDVTGTTAALRGSLSGSIALTGVGGMARLRGDSSGLSRLTVLNSAVAEIDNASRLNNQGVYLGNGGTLARAADAAGGNLRIDNAISVGYIAPDGTIYASNRGGLSSYITTSWPWEENADSLHDTGLRFIVAGQISSTFINSLLTINDDAGANGTVVLTTGNTYYGSFDVLRGVLEITDEGCLGQGANDVNRYSVNLGGSTVGAAGDRPTFRVVGGRDTSQTISHAIQLNSVDATYEVFTVAQIVGGTIADGSTVTGTLDGEINGTITGTITDGTVSGSVQILDRDITTMADRDRFTVHQAGLVMGAYDLNKAGDGILVLDCDNNYTGDTVIWHGTLQISAADSINNNASAKIFVGGDAGRAFEETGFRPVFETTLSAEDSNTIVINADIMINQTNSIIRTTGLGNETIINNNSRIGTDLRTGFAQYAAILNKDGAGTLTLHGVGEWGKQGTGELLINQGTVQFKAPKNLSSGTITIGTDYNTYKDIELVDNNDSRKNVPVTYQATLRLEDNCGDVAISNKISLAAPRNPNNPEVGAFIDVGYGSILTLTGKVEEANVANGSDLNKVGAGELVLNSKGGNSYTGWTKIFDGTLSVAQPDSLLNSLGVDLIGNGTTFKLDGADQTIRNLQGVDPAQMTSAPSTWNLSRTVDIGDRTLTVKPTANTTYQNNSGRPESAKLSGITGTLNLLQGNIISNGGTLVMGAEVTNATLAAGFKGFNGDFQINAGNITTLTDTTLIGLSGKAGTMLDIYGNTLTLNIGNSCQYDGAIVSRSLVPQNPKPSDYGAIIKDGKGILTTNFEVMSGGVTVPGQTFNGSVTLKDGGIVSNSNFTMAAGNSMTFYVHIKPNGDVDPLVFDISGHTANFRAPTNLNVFFDSSATGWDSHNDSKTVAQIRGNDLSDYSGLKPNEYNSLFYQMDTVDVTSNGRHDLNVVMNITGLQGVGGTFNQAAVGDNLDGIRVTNLTRNPGLAKIIERLWETGCNLETAEERAAAMGKIRGVFDELSGDVIANATFMGLDSPWKQPFDRLNLDSQMVYVQPQQRAYRGQAIANMRNLWFTPTYQGVVARSDGNARGFNIERPGYKLGWDKRVAQNASVGFLLGYSSPSLHQNADIINASDFQFGLYGGAMVGYYVEVKGYIGFGHQNFKSTRTADLTALGTELEPMPSQTAHATFDGDTFNFSLEVARPLFLGFAVLRPTLGLDSEHAYRYAFTESGDAVAMHFDRSSISRTRARFALALETCTLERMIFSGRLGYSALLGGYDYADVTAQFVNAYTPASKVRSVATGKSYFDAGVGCRCFMNQSKTLSLLADYDASVSSHWAEHRGLVGFQLVY